MPLNQMPHSQKASQSKGRRLRNQKAKRPRSKKPSIKKVPGPGFPDEPVSDHGPRQLPGSYVIGQLSAGLPGYPENNVKNSGGNLVPLRSTWMIAIISKTMITYLESRESPSTFRVRISGGLPDFEVRRLDPRLRSHCRSSSTSISSYYCPHLSNPVAPGNGIRHQYRKAISPRGLSSKALILIWSTAGLAKRFRGPGCWRCVVIIKNPFCGACPSAWKEDKSQIRSEFVEGERRAGRGPSVFY